MTVIVDYGVGNLFSLKCSFNAVGEQAIITKNKDDILNADRIVLPGVGAFSDAIKKLNESGLVDAIFTAVNSGVPLLGICLGMQLLFEESYEYGVHKGLGLIKGKVTPIDDKNGSLKIPHIGWNSLSIKKSPIFRYINNGDYVYFVHSFAGTECSDSVIATSEYGETVTAAVQKGNVYGCQFHPEKSGEVGLKILKAFTELKKENK